MIQILKHPEYTRTMSASAPAAAPAPGSAPAPAPAVSAPTKIQLLELLAAIGTAQWQDFAAAAARHGLTSMQAKVLSQLHGPVPMRGLAEALVCDASNITGIVDRLESHGFVRREVSPADRRVKNVVATDLGRETIRRVREEMQATHGALDTLDEEERATLYGLLERLRPVMEDRDPERDTDRDRA
ncbi:MAG: hypothetical protein QOF44_4350 [Streptomyces sp.]|nr:hypothetical protein [Streptomyces sp.]